jgi:hypothetical protein
MPSAQPMLAPTPSAPPVIPVRPPAQHRIRRVLFTLLLMAVIFLAGGVSGWLYGVRFAVSTAIEQKANMRDVPDRAIPRLVRDLALTPEQLPEFERIFRKYHAEMTRVEADRALQVHQYFYEMGRDILPLLTPEQQTKFREVHHRICAFILGPIPRLDGTDESSSHDPCDDL